MNRRVFSGHIAKALACLAIPFKLPKARATLPEPLKPTKAVWMCFPYGDGIILTWDEEVGAYTWSADTRCQSPSASSR